MIIVSLLVRIIHSIYTYENGRLKVRIYHHYQIYHLCKQKMIIMVGRIVNWLIMTVRHLILQVKHLLTYITKHMAQQSLLQNICLLFITQ